MGFAIVLVSCARNKFHDVMHTYIYLRIGAYTITKNSTLIEKLAIVLSYTYSMTPWGLPKKGTLRWRTAYYARGGCAPVGTGAHPSDPRRGTWVSPGFLWGPSQVH
jgi:hypothetical protein